MKYLYKYPQAAFPYDALVAENRRRDRRAPEFELIDTGVFDADRYFDVVVEYAKAAPDDVLVRITATNRGPEAAELHLLPTLWYRNTWSWDTAGPERPTLGVGEGSRHAMLEAEHPSLGARWLYCEGAPELLFTENDTNVERIWGRPNVTPYVKDSINDYVVEGKRHAINPEQRGTKAAAHYRLTLEPGASVVTRLRLSNTPLPAGPFGEDFEVVFAHRLREADEFYDTVIPRRLSDDGKRVMRQALAGLLWSKQFYHYYVRRWLEGDPACPPPPKERLNGRNHEWRHLYNEDVISMPDKWEYPWYAAWDLAFHMIPFALIDPDFAKAQLILFLREWYMHPNGQIPAYEWALRRREPAGARVGRAARLPDRAAPARQGRPRVPREDLPQAPAQLHLVGESQGHRGQERLPGRLPRPRQHRRLRPVGAAADRGPHRAIRRHLLDGDVLPEHARDRARAGQAGSGLRGRRLEVLRALRLHRSRDPESRRGRHQPLGRRRRLLLRRAAQRGRRPTR